ncbi:hypothetical protein [Salipaludibacillus daqingensis]|uniref:hypothetical protein n=1 Tax=Salipaludibacillus daqingensis TaxID=3041001 RepID=UPI002475EBAD|nr:hypothetical protein [Salipaludibacillus daqingensis]
MASQFRHYLRSIVKFPSIHYVYLTSYPVTNLSEEKEMNILHLIQYPIIFVMRGPICLKGVSELLSVGDGVIFDYEIERHKRNTQLHLSQHKSFVSPGVLAFIKPEIEELKQTPRSIYMNFTKDQLSPKKQVTVLDLLIKNYSSKLRNINKINYCQLRIQGKQRNNFVKDNYYY